MNRRDRRAKLKQPCHCGSGLRYDRCHYRREKALQAASKIFREREVARETFEKRHGFVRKPQILEMGDRHIVVVGNEIYHQINSGPYNFVNAIHDYALHVFGAAFLEEEENKPFEDRHPAIQWLHAYIEHHNRNLMDKGAKPEDLQFGLGAAWIRLAYDLHTIRDNAELQSILRTRMLNPVDFQSARHELWVAALFIAAGFEINFEDETDNSKTHPEFIAVEQETGLRVAVEAKSRRRNGVKGFSGGTTLSGPYRVDARNLVLDAYKKSEDNIPLYVFVDVNLPPASQEQKQSWFAELDDLMSDLTKEGYCDPCPAHAVFFHNDPSHFIDRLISNSTDNLWITHYTDRNPNKTFPKNIVERIMTAHNQRATPPMDIPDF